MAFGGRKGEIVVTIGRGMNRLDRAKLASSVTRIRDKIRCFYGVSLRVLVPIHALKQWRYLYAEYLKPMSQGAQLAVLQTFPPMRGSVLDHLRQTWRGSFLPVPLSFGGRVWSC